MSEKWNHTKVGLYSLGRVEAKTGKAYRNLPALLSEICLHVFQGHHSTLSARRAGDISKRRMMRPSSSTARDKTSWVAIGITWLPA